MKCSTTCFLLLEYGFVSGEHLSFFLEFSSFYTLRWCSLKSCIIPKTVVFISVLFHRGCGAVFPVKRCFALSLSYIIDCMIAPYVEIVHKIISLA